MRLLLLTLTALTLIAATAADLRDTGDLLAALDGRSVAARTGALVMALERTGRAAPTLTRALAAHLAGDDSAEHQRRLAAVWRSRPADMYAVGVALRHLSAHTADPGELAELSRLTLNTVDPAALTPPERRIYYSLLRGYLDILLKNGELSAAVEFCDKLAARAPTEPGVVAATLRIAAQGCFMATDTAPGMRGWAALSAADPWKIRVDRLRRKIAATHLRDRADAAALTEAAIVLHDRKLLEEILERRNRTAGTEPDEAELMGLGILMEIPRLAAYAPAESRALALAMAGDPAAAETELAATPQPLRNEVRLTILERRGDYAAIRKMVMRPRFALRTIPAFSAACSAALKLRDAALMGRIIRELPPADKVDPVIANAVGYTAAELEVELPTAEKLLDRALRAVPGNYAFLDSMAWLKFRRKKYAEAHRLILLALKNRRPVDDTAVIFLHAADIELVASGDRAAARAYLTRAEKMAGPENREFDYRRAAELRRMLQ